MTLSSSGRMSSFSTKAIFFWKFSLIRKKYLNSFPPKFVFSDIFLVKAAKILLFLPYVMAKHTFSFISVRRFVSFCWISQNLITQPAFLHEIFDSSLVMVSCYPRSIFSYKMYLFSIIQSIKIWRQKYPWLSYTKFFL